jgi:hypothetical protein
MTAVDSEQDKPEGTEQHEPGTDPARGGPREDSGAGGDEQVDETRPPATGQPGGEQSPARPGVTSPKRS